MSSVFKYRVNEVIKNNVIIFKLWCYRVSDWNISREMLTFEKDGVNKDHDLYASNLTKYNYLLIFKVSSYLAHIIIDIKQREVSDVFYILSFTGAFFRNFGD